MTDSSTGGYLQPSAPSPPDTDSDLNQVFHDLFVGITGLTGDMVRPRWSATPAKQPEPATNWLSFGVVEQQKDANPYLQHDSVNGNGSTTMVRHEEIKVEVSCYGTLGQQYATAVRDGLEIPQNIEAIAASPHLLAYVESENIIAAPELINQQWVRRFDFTVRFRREIKRTYSILDIASAQIQLGFVAGPISSPRNDNINVTP